MKLNTLLTEATGNVQCWDVYPLHQGEQWKNDKVTVYDWKKDFHTHGAKNIHDPSALISVWNSLKSCMGELPDLLVQFKFRPFLTIAEKNLRNWKFRWGPIKYDTIVLRVISAVIVRGLDVFPCRWLTDSRLKLQQTKLEIHIFSILWLSELLQ